MKERSDVPHVESLNLLFAGGGTGGHIVPGRNLADACASNVPPDTVCFLTAGRPVESPFFADRAYPRIDLFPGHASRPSPLNPSPWIGALRRVRKVVREFTPSAIFLLGGYAALPALLLHMVRATSARKLYTLELNALPGRTARLSAHFATRIFCQFEAAARRLGPRAVVTGAPLPPGFGEGLEDRAALREAFGLDPDRTTLLVAGGSLGARAVNRFVTEHLHVLASRGGAKFQVIHVTGAREHDEVRTRYEGADVRAAVLPFVDPMARALKAADLILCRGGGMTLAEVAALRVPAVVMPYPHHKDHHQLANARELEALGGARILEEREATENAFIENVIGLLEDRETRLRMAEGLTGGSGAGFGESILDYIRRDLNLEDTVRTS